MENDQTQLALSDMISSLADGNQEAAQQAFASAMSIKVAEKLDDMKSDVAQNFYK